MQPVLQRGYDANVSGANLTETVLNASNVGSGSFGLLFRLPVDERVYAQPLYVPGVAISGMGTHNVLYVATMNDSVYAFDADVGGAPLWSVNLASLVGATAPIWANFAIPNFDPPGHLGILSTPAIDPNTNVMYVVACTLEGGTMAYRLHAIDITSGTEPYGPGVLITGSYSGVVLNPPYVLQRMSLVIVNGQVIFGFSGQQVEKPLNYDGWVMAYGETTLQQTGVFAPEVNGNLQGGIWQSGRPPAVDSSGYVYVFTGNSMGGGFNGVTDFSESALKLDSSNSLTLVDYFTVGNWQHLDKKDLDLSSSGPLLIPGTGLLTGGGKTGYLYVLDSSDLGHWNANDSQVVQKDYISAGEIHGGPVYWTGSTTTGGPLLYDWGSTDVLKAYAFNGTTFATSPTMEGTYTEALPGGFLAISANGNTPGSGVLWANTPGNKQVDPVLVPTLHAFNAENITQELWNSQINATRDGAGAFASNMPPMVANGKVYLANGSFQVLVYGLESFSVSADSMAFGNQAIGTPTAPQTVTVTNTSTAAVSIAAVTVTGTNTSLFTQANTCGTSLAVGAACSVSVTFKPTKVGAASAALNILAGGGVGTQTIALSGTGIAVPYTVAPASLAFGSVGDGAYSAAEVVTVTNTIDATVPIADIEIAGANATQYSDSTTCGASLAAGTSCTINVTFAPTLTGVLPATLSVVAGSGDGTVSVALRGTGVGGLAYTLSPATLSFGSVTSGTSSAPQQVTVTNIGGAALPITSITFTGASKAQFTESNNCGASIAIGTNCTVNVTFAPTETGAIRAWLSVNPGGGAGAKTVLVTGTGD